MGGLLRQRVEAQYERALMQNEKEKCANWSRRTRVMRTNSKRLVYFLFTSELFKIREALAVSRTSHQQISCHRLIAALGRKVKMYTAITTDLQR